MNLSAIQLPDDWYALKVHQKCSLYVNIRHQVASLSPVFELHQSQMILKDILGLSIDFPLLEKTVEKIKKQINLQTNKIPLIDDEIDHTVRLQMRDQQAKNAEMIRDIQAKVEELKIYVPTDKSGYESVAGV